MTDTTPVTITADELREALPSGGVVVLEVVRHPTDEPLRDHLPGARRAVLTVDLVGEAGDGTGDLPLPDVARIQDAVRRWGIDADSLVVVHSREQAALAARAWWTLRWAGVPDVRYLDGGHAAWVAAGGELGDEPSPDGDGTFEVVLGSLPVLDVAAAGDLARRGLLLDVRPAASYADGHVPGAVSSAGVGRVDSDGRLLDPEALRAAYGAVGVDGDVEVGASCGSGTGAALEVLALATIGVGAGYFPGSFSAWAADAARPVAKGSEPV